VTRGGSLRLLVSALAVPASADVLVEARGAGPSVVHHRKDAGALAAFSASARRSGLSRSEVMPTVDRHASRLGLDPDLVHAVIRAESAYDPYAVSTKGAAGLMQLMPETQRDYRVEDPFDPEENIAAGSAYLKRLLEDFEDSLELALAAYNAGPETVRRYGGVPPYPETRRYLERVLASYRPGRAIELDAALPDGAAAGSGGRPTYVYRDAGGRLVISTSPPGRR